MKNNRQVAAFFVLATVLFALAYSQSPLYTSNQYQYFLHGMARAGVGLLSEDWLANTSDPTPLFSWLVEITARIHALGLIHFYYALLMGIYLVSVAGIVESIFPLRTSPSSFLIFLGGMIFMHSAGLRYLLSQILGTEWGYIFEGGVAGQRLLGSVFQPSVFGVFLLFSLFLYLRRRVYAAILAAVFAASVHPTYLLSAAALTAIYLFDQFFLEKKKQKTVWMALLALAAVTPIVYYAITTFTGGTPETAAKARDILVNIRIPHHARITDWFDATTLMQLLLLGISLFLARRHRLFLLLCFPLGLSVLLTVIQYFSGNLALALLFPWRLSTWLMPVALGLILAKSTHWLTFSLPTFWKRVLLSICLVLVLMGVVTGVIRTYLEHVQAAQSPALSVQQYVADHRQPGDVYLIPVKMYDFRLSAGVPVYDDFFSIPYQYGEVIEWYSRFLRGKYFYELAECDRLIELTREGVTHVILPADFPVVCPMLSPVYTDHVYGVYELHPE